MGPSPSSIVSQVNSRTPNNNQSIFFLSFAAEEPRCWLGIQFETVKLESHGSEDQTNNNNRHIQPNQLVQLLQYYLQLLFPEPSPVLNSSRSHPVDPLGGPHQILLTAMMATAFLSNHTKPSRGSRRTVATPSSLLKLGNCILATSAHSQEFLIPTNQASFRPYPPNPHPGGSFPRTNQISCSLSLEFQDSKMWHLQASHMQTHAVRDQCGQAN